MSIIEIKVKVDAGKICVDPDPAPLYKSKGDTAKWEGVPEGLEFMVDFKERSPFVKKIFRSKESEGGKPESGPIAIKPVTPQENFKYTVILGDGSRLDPGIIIRP